MPTGNINEILANVSSVGQRGLNDRAALCTDEGDCPTNAVSITCESHWDLSEETWVWYLKQTVKYRYSRYE